MADLTTAQWILVPLLVFADAVVALGIVAMLGYMVIAFFGGFRVPAQELRANTPGLPGDPRNRVVR